VLGAVYRTCAPLIHCLRLLSTFSLLHQAGLGVSVLGAMPSVGLYFGVYSYCKRTIGPTFVKRFGSEREDGKGQFCSDRAWQTFSIALSAAIGE
jgi:hypothetical protein